MTADAAAGLRLFTPGELAALWQIRESWIKEQCRLRRVPFIKAAGQYRFREQHARAILALLEHSPATPAPAAPAVLRSVPRRPATPAATPAPDVPFGGPLVAKSPRRARRAS